MPDVKKTKMDYNWLVKAYNNVDFLNSPAARTIRIMTEMIEPAERLRKNRIYNTVVFFGSARTVPLKTSQQNLQAIEKQMKDDKKASAMLKAVHAQAHRDVKISRYYEDAATLSEKLTKWFNQPQNKSKNFKICTGGGPGIMEAANRGAQKAKGQSIGLNISLLMEQNPNIYQSKNISFEFHYFFIRKFWFFYLAKALIVFPGGFGTFDELFELLTIVQTEKSKKYMPIVLFGRKYWEEVVNFDALLKWGMISKSDYSKGTRGF